MKSRLPKTTLYKVHAAIAYSVFASLVITTVSASALMLTLWFFSQRLPNPDSLTQRTIPQSTVIYDRNGQTLYQVYRDENRTLVKLEDIPQHVIDATLAAEDANFYRHGGVDVNGVIFAAQQTLVEGNVQGGSTITQQLVKNTLLTNQQSLDRKIKELILSMRLEQRYTKDQILQMYLNEIPYGGEVYGIQAAAKTFLGKDIKEVTLAEAAMLAGLPQSPSRYSPFTNPEAALGRQSYVLHLMNKAGYINQADYLATKEQVIAFASPRVEIKAPWFTLWIKDQLEKKYGKEMVEQGGLRITTTLDLSTQAVAEQEIGFQLDRMDRGGANANQAALLSLDPKTGQILAMVGSRNYFDQDSQGNVNATLAFRQPGSSIKPFVYLTGLLQNKITPATMLNDSRTAFYAGIGQPLYIPNESDGKYWGPMLMRDALANSRNIPTVQVMERIGLASMIATSSLAGIPTYADDPSRYGLALSLGGGEVRMIDLAAAYNMLANNGSTVPPTGILKITTASGQIIEEFKQPLVDQKFDAKQVYQITNILSDNQARQKLFGPGNMLQLNRPAAVKTGTTDSNKDAWTVGYTPNLLTAVWVGNFDGQPMNGVMGSTGATPIWHHFMSKILADMPIENFVRPSGLVDKPITATGQLSCSPATTVRTEIFVEGTEPKASCLPFTLPSGEDTPPSQVAGQQIWRYYNNFNQQLRQQIQQEMTQP